MCEHCPIEWRDAVTGRVLHRTKAQPPPCGCVKPTPVKVERHRWAKLRIHVYICRKCGCGKVNAQDANGDWFATFHLPDGGSYRGRRVPPCAVGDRTARYLAKYAEDLAVPF